MALPCRFTFEHYFGTNEFSVTYPAGGLQAQHQRDSEVDNEVTILVVEDDQLIQALVEEALSDGGFGSSITASGEDAIALLNNDKSLYRALVTDISLAGKLDGWEVAAPPERAIRRCRSCI